MFRIVPIDPSNPSGKKRGRRRPPLHVSLSTSSHDHADPAQAGIILTIGRTGCDVNFPDMDQVDTCRSSSVDARLGLQTIKITATVITASGIARYVSDYTLSLDRNLSDLTWAVAATTDGGRSYARTVPYDCNVPGLDRKRIQRVPLGTPLAELLTKAWPLKSKVHFEFVVADNDVRRPRIVEEGPHQILRLVTTRPDLVGKSWPATNGDGSTDGGIRCYMPARSRAEKEACRAASDGIVLVVEQGDRCDPRIPLTRILNGKRPESSSRKIASLRIVGYGGRLVDRRPFAVVVRETQTVLDVMASIEARRKLSPALQCLTHRGKELCDVTKRLVDCRLEEGATLILTQRMTPKPVSAPAVVSTRRSIKTSKRTHNLPGPKARMTLTSLSLLSDADIAENAQKAAPWATAAPVASIGELDCVRLGSVRSDQTTDRLCSVVEIKRMPINLCPSKIGAGTRSQIEAIGPALGVALADSAIGFNSTPYDALLGRTHLLVPSDSRKQSPTIKSLSAWCLNVPIVTTDFVLKGLANRKSSRDPLPEAKTYSPWRGGGSGIEYSQAIIAEEEGKGPCHGRRDPLKGFLFISLAPMEIEGLVLAAGATVFRAYLLHDALFCDIDWLDLKKSEGWPRDGDPMGGRIAVIDPMLEIFQPRLQFLDQYAFPRVFSHEIVSAINRMEGLMYDVGGNLLRGVISVQPARFHLRWENRKISIDNLPPDALRLILQDYVGGPTKDMLTLLRLSSSSKGLQKCIFQDSPFLWTKIDLSNLDEKYRKRLRDKQLEALLIRTQAVQMTKCLNLNGCKGLRGCGLGPLRGSTVLQSINLSFSGSHDHRDPILDADTICSVLESMPPFSLDANSGASSGLMSLELDYFDISRKIRFTKDRKASIDKLSEMEKRFGSFLASATCCEDCGILIRTQIETGLSEHVLETVSADRKEEIIGDDAKNCFCPGCKHMICGNEDGGCRKIQYCDLCGLERCNRCKLMEECHSCDEVICCQKLIQCGECKGKQCEYCTFEGISINTHTCSACDVIRCTNCRAFDFCSGCEERFCRGLHGTITCSGCASTFCDSCGDMEQCGACQNFFCPTCEGTLRCRDCDISCCTGCRGASCTSCEEIICATCNDQDGPSFSTTCDACKKSLCQVCAPSCSKEGCSNNICKDCRNKKKSGCGNCDKHYCSEHQQHCSVGGCKSLFCVSCVMSVSSDDEMDAIGHSCSLCSYPTVFPSKSFVCACCFKKCKLGFCSECDFSFVCTNEGCIAGGRNQRYCKICEVSYCSECGPSHKEYCEAPNDSYAEVVWFDHMSEEVNRRMKRFYKEKRPSNPYGVHYHPYMSEHASDLLKKECPEEKFFTLSLQKKIAFAEKVYVEVRKRHKSEDILDIGSARVQPRIDSKFKKKPKKRTGQH